MTLVRWREPLIALVALFSALGVYVLAGSYQASAALFPRLIAIVVMITSVALFVRGLFRPDAGNPVEPIEPHSAVRMIAAIVLSILYVIGVKKIGYISASALFIPITAYVLGIRRPFMLLITTVLFLSLTAALFLMVFKVPLPREIILQYLSGG